MLLRLPVGSSGGLRGIGVLGLSATIFDVFVGGERKNISSSGGWTLIFEEKVTTVSLLSKRVRAWSMVSHESKLARLVGAVG